MHRTGFFRGLRAVVLDCNAHLLQALIEVIVLLKHHVLVTGGKYTRRATVFLDGIAEIVDVRRHLFVWIEENSGELSRTLDVVSADRAGTRAADVRRKIGKTALIAHLLGIQKERRDEAEVTTGRIADRMELRKALFRKESDRRKNVAQNALKISRR